jgi:hypothetical protein
VGRSSGLRNGGKATQRSTGESAIGQQTFQRDPTVSEERKRSSAAARRQARNCHNSSLSIPNEKLWGIGGICSKMCLPGHFPEMCRSRATDSSWGGLGTRDTDELEPSPTGGLGDCKVKSLSLSCTTRRLSPAGRAEPFAVVRPVVSTGAGRTTAVREGRRSHANAGR